MNTEGKTGWEEIVDARFDGKFDVQELNEMAALAYKCINRAPRKRPSMRDIVQVLSQILKLRHSRRKQHSKSYSAATADDVSVDLDQLETKISVSEHRREESVTDLDQLETETSVSEHRREQSVDSAGDTFEV